MPTSTLLMDYHGDSKYSQFAWTCVYSKGSPFFENISCTLLNFDDSFWWFVADMFHETIQVYQKDVLQLHYNSFYIIFLFLLIIDILHIYKEVCFDFCIDINWIKISFCSSNLDIIPLENHQNFANIFILMFFKAII